MYLKINKYDVIIHSQPLSILDRYTQHDIKQPEAGGIILGRIVDNQINILRLSVPTSLDKYSRTNFERSKVGAQIIIDYEFLNSASQIIYLGEWHTHPEAHPTPSATDLKMLKEQFKNNKLNTEFLLLLIKGTKDIYFRIIDNNRYFEALAQP